MKSKNLNVHERINVRTFIHVVCGFKDAFNRPTLKTENGEPFEVFKTNAGVYLLFVPGVFHGGLNLSQMGFDNEMYLKNEL